MPVSRMLHGRGPSCRDPPRPAPDCRRDQDYEVARMANAGGVRVGCTLSNPVELGRIRNAIQHEGGSTSTLTRAGVLEAATAGRISALVYDMEPGDRSSADFVERVHAARPDWPVWLYYPSRVSVIERVTEVASLRGVWATPQQADPMHEAAIRAHVRRLLVSVPRVRLLRLMDSMLRPVPFAVRRFLELGLERRDQGVQGSQRSGGPLAQSPLPRTAVSRGDAARPKASIRSPAASLRHVQDLRFRSAA